MCWFSVAIGVLIGTPIAGTLANAATANYLPAQIFAGCVMLSSSFFLVPTLLRARRWAKQVEQSPLGREKM